MKITFIYPKFEKFLEKYPDLAEIPKVASTWAFRMPPSMAIPILINLLPSDIDWKVVDQNIETVDYNDDADLIAISFFTPQAGYAYEIGDEFLKRGKTVLMGGMHPSMAPQDTLPHCTSLCLGEGDTIFPTILKDFNSGKLRPIYRSTDYPHSSEIKNPKQGIFKTENKYDWHASLISISRGCPYGCDWCNIPIYQGDRIRLRPIDDVVKDISSLAENEFYFTDDMILLGRPAIQQYMIDLCNRIREYDVRFFLSCSPAMTTNPEFLDTIASAGAKSIYIVFASDPCSSRFYAEHQGIWQRTIDLVRQIEDRGMRFFPSFGVGFDCMFENQFDLVLQFCFQTHVKTAEFFIATPFPGTAFWNRIQAENRFLSPRNWNHFNCANVVFKPKHISETRLTEGFVNLWKEYIKQTDYQESIKNFIPKQMTT